MEKYKHENELSVPEQIQPQLDADVAHRFKNMRTPVLLGSFSLDSANRPTLRDLHKLEDATAGNIGGSATFSYNPKTGKFTYIISDHNL